ncbi:hypothetical protein GKZ90_0009125 [Flavobacterium sp. MC2016-06]|uniref:hypothetical protein n=1 Tax=Flavobacterium sp. MC2016-06 TaxID=2676308 RepID=UPI0012BAB1F0|nr:hypothetical protein [Flavobacterium sp. MC2016-06]MBU3859374.1 hypothetical protein [Flavobacterium sp. MC2016-06]
MNRFKFLILIILLSSCNKNDENKLLYNQLKDYNEFLKNTAENQKSFLVIASEENNYFKKRYDSLNKIELKLQDYFEIYRYKDRDKLIAIRDTFNAKFKLGLKLIPPSDYKNIDDSIFNKVIQIEYLKLRIEFQSRHMVFRGDRFN